MLDASADAPRCDRDLSAPPPTTAHIISIGRAVPPQRYSQEQLIELFGLGDAKTRRLFRNSHIKYRNLYLPAPGPDGMPDESVETLNRKHLTGCLEIGGEALLQALSDAGLTPRDIDMLVCVTTTGYLCPGLSAHFIKTFGLRDNVHRIDVVGMGCNAALNALQPACMWAQANPGRNVAMLAVEICSAAYVRNDSIETAVVNSLFGDGAAAVIIRGQTAGTAGAWPAVVDFASLTLTDAIHTMRFDLDDGRLSFFLDRDIPYVIGANCGRPVRELLERARLRQRDIRHWVVHSGGKKVIDSVKMNLDLTDHDMRHTLHVLENHGNISSCACLFSLARLVEEGAARPGDHGILMAMGPGAAIETARLIW